MCDEERKEEKKGEDSMSTVYKPTVEERCPRESLKGSLKEMKLMREGKLSKKKWDEFCRELKSENGE